jgi:PAS domain S-box-containing protein
MNAPGRRTAGWRRRPDLITTGSLLALAALVVVAALSYRSIERFNERIRWVEHTYEVLRTSDLVFTELKDAEAAVRGYIISGEKSHLDPYEAALATVPQNLERLARLTADNPSQSARAVALAELAQRQLADTARTLESYRLGSRSGISGQVRAQLAAGKAAMDDARALMARFHRDEEALLSSRGEEAGRAARQSTTIIIAGNLAALSILALALVLLRREVASRTRAQRAAQHLATEIEDLYQRAPCGYHSVDEDGRIVHMNDTELSWLGYRREEVIGKLRFLDLVAPECRATVRDNFPRLLKGGTTDNLEYDLVRKDGSRFPVSVNATAVMDADGRFVMSRTTMFDISALNAARTRLIEANAFLDAIVENIPSMVFVKHADTLRFARINRAEEMLLGMPRSDVIGKSDHELFPREQADFFVAKDREVLASEEVVDVQEESLSTSSGDRILHTRKFCLRDPAGRPQYLLGISHDITERKHAEERIRALATDLENRARQLEVANKELESFSYSVSHDLRSPLRAIDGFSRLLEEDYQKVLDAEGLRLLSVIRQSSQRMATLIDDLLAFSQLGRKALSVEKIDMRQLVADAIEDVRSAAPSSGPEMSTGELPAASGDRILLRQVWVNLISNAFKYSSKNERPRVEIGSRTDDGGNAVYYVRDNGVGFDMRYYDKLFGVFQRLHRADEFPGTGVGLAIVQRVVARHGGRVWAEARPGNGATFFFSIPGKGTT